MQDTTNPCAANTMDIIFTVVGKIIVLKKHVSDTNGNEQGAYDDITNILDILVRTPRMKSLVEEAARGDDEDRIK